MRVVFILPGRPVLPIGGYAVVYQYANWLCRIPDVEVHLVHDCYHLRYENRRAAGSAVNQLIQRAAPYLGALGVARFTPWAKIDERVVDHSSARGIRRLCWNPEDVVVATSVETAEVASQLTQSRGVRGCYFLQGVEDWNVSREYLHRTLRLPLRKVAVAPWISDYCRELGEDCEVVLNAVDPDQFSVGPDDSRRLVSALLAPANRKKRTDVAIEVLNRLAQSGTPTAAFGTCARPTSLCAEVAFLERPSHAALLGLYQESRVFFCVSESEGFGLTPAEATLAGAAVVSTDNGGVNAYGESFVVFTGAPDAEATLAAIRALLDCPAEERRRAAIGRAHLLAYSPEDAAAQFATVVLGSPGGSARG